MYISRAITNFNEKYEAGLGIKEMTAEETPDIFSLKK